MNNFDPQTGQPVNKAKVVAPINTRTFLYHKVRPAIVVEGKGATDADRRADVAAQIEAKKKDGYQLERFHGQHPHSNDEHRLDHQKRAAEAGDKEAKKALIAKGILPAEPEPKKA